MTITREEMKRAAKRAAELAADPPAPGWEIRVKLGARSAWETFHSRSECVAFLRHLADELRKPLATVILCCSLSQIEEHYDGALWCDRTPPELDAWGDLGNEAMEQEAAWQRLGGPVRWDDDADGPDDCIGAWVLVEEAA